MLKSCFIRKISCLLIVFSMLLCSNVYSIPADVDVICGRDYYPAVHKVLQNAQKSIDVVLYFIKYDPGKLNNVGVLVNDLVEAHRRGVKVKVILDRNVQFRAQRDSGEKFHVEEKNKRIFDYLKAAGIEVYYDNENTFTHAKAIVIDNNIVILGSNNWSESSLNRNNETGVIIRSSELPNKFQAYFNTIAIDYEESGKESVSYTKLSKDILTGAFSRFVTTDNKGCWNLFLWLIENYKPGQTIDFSYDIVDLDLEVGGDKDRYRARINENLKKLDKNYGLIEAKTSYGKNAEVIIKPWVEGKEPLFEIPNIFYKYGWNERLSLAGQFCLFINFLYSGPSHEMWFKSKKLLSEEFKVSHSTISKGMLELKEWDLIEIERGDIDKGFADRPANRYRLKNLYSLDNFNNELEKLREKYGHEKVRIAREYAKVILDEYNIEHIEDIVLLINEYGTDKVAYAFDKISKYKIDNPMRNLRYVAGILGSEAKNSNN